MDKTPNQPTNPIIGVCVRYCIDGKVVDTWVDLKKITALAWGDGNVSFHKGGGSHNAGNLPGSERAPDCGVMRVYSVNNGICWWDGNAWICGD